jgi:hypothetical protein
MSVITPRGDAGARPMSVRAEILRIAVLLVALGLSAGWSAFLALQIFRAGTIALEFLLE